MTDLSVSTVVIDGIEFRRGLDLIAMAGATAIEPAYISGYMPFDERTFCREEGAALAALAADAGLSINAVSVHMDLGEPHGAQKLLRRLEFVAAAGARILVTNASRAAQHRAFEATVEETLESFAAAGVVLALENPGHGAGALLTDGKTAAPIIAAFDHPNLRLNYDAGNAMTYGACKSDPLTDLLAALPQSAHVHLKDIRTSAEGWEFCPVGDGMVGYDGRFFAALKDARIPIGIEHPIRLWRPGFGDPVRRERPPTEDQVRAATRRSLELVKTHLS